MSRVTVLRDVEIAHVAIYRTNDLSVHYSNISQYTQSLRPNRSVKSSIHPTVNPTG